MEALPQFLTEEDIYERGWTPQILGASLAQPIQELRLESLPNGRPIRVYLLSEIERLERLDLLQEAVAARFCARRDTDELARHLRRFSQLAESPSTPLPSEEVPFAFLEWWLARSATAPTLEESELQRRRTRRVQSRKPRS